MKAVLHPGNSSTLSRNFAITASLHNVEKDTDELIAKVSEYKIRLCKKGLDMFKGICDRFTKC